MKRGILFEKLIQLSIFPSTTRSIDVFRETTERWIDGKIDPIYKKCEATQQELNKSRRCQSSINKQFAKQFLEEILTTAMNLIEQKDSKGVLQPNQSVLEELQKMHPPRQQVVTSKRIQLSPAEENPVVFEFINQSETYHAAMQTRGSNGPSGLDATNFRRMACSTNFKQIIENFCKTQFEIARKICFEKVDPVALETYTACRTIALDNDGRSDVRPFGIEKAYEESKVKQFRSS